MLNVRLSLHAFASLDDILKGGPVRIQSRLIELHFESVRYSTTKYLSWRSTHSQSLILALKGGTDRSYIAENSRLDFR